MSRKPRPRTHFGFRPDPDVLEAVEAAQRDGRTLTWLANEALRRFLAFLGYHHDKPRK